MDILRVLVLYQTEEKISELFVKWVFPLCEASTDELKKTAKKEAKTKNKESGEMETEQPVEKVDRSLVKLKIRMVDMEHKKAYRILEEIFKSDQENCKAFMNENRKKIQRMLVHSLNKAADSSKATRLK